MLEPVKHFRNKRQAVSATVFDLSLGGARVRALYDPRIMIGTQVHIAAGGGTGIAEIRRINADHDPHEALYGIRFVHLDAALLLLFNDTLDARRTEVHAIDAT